jgi:hypothetical protein
MKISTRYQDFDRVNNKLQLQKGLDFFFLTTSSGKADLGGANVIRLLLYEANCLNGPPRGGLVASSRALLRASVGERP